MGVHSGSAAKAVASVDTVLITGAAGFVGRHVCRLLGSDPAWRVVAATRDGRDGTRRLDLRGPVDGALAGVDAVVHCAVGGRAVTVDGTRALLREAAAARVRRFVHISSVAVYGAAVGAVAEDTPLVASGSRGYAGWKAAAEQACATQAGLAVVRLRPAIVYGPGSVPWVSQVARRIRSGRWGVFGAAGEGTCNLVHVEDVAAAVACALAAPAAAGAFNVNGPEAVTWNRWFTLVAQAIGAPALRPVAPATLRARSLLSLPVKAAARLRPGLAEGWLLGAPAASELALFARRTTYPVAAAQAALGWQPRIGIAAGLAGCVERLRLDGLAA